MLKVTMKDGRPRWIAAGHVCHIGEGEPGMTTVYFDTGATLTVRDDMEDLAKRLHEILVVA